MEWKFRRYSEQKKRKSSFSMTPLSFGAPSPAIPVNTFWNNTRVWQTDRRTDRQSSDRHLSSSNTSTCIACYATAPLRGGGTSEFVDETYPAKTRGMGILYGENCMTLTSTVFYRAMHFSAYARSWDRMSSVRLSVCLSVRLSVTLMDCDHIGWKSWKLIARTISPTPSLFVAKRRST